MHDWVIAIDLGPALSCAAVLAGPRPEVLVIPSVVCLAPDGLLLAGEEAGPAIRDPLEVFRYERRVRLGDRTIETVDLLAALLDRIVKESVRRFGGRPAAAVVTHPAGWTQRDLARLGKAAHRAGLPTAIPLSAPVATQAYQPFAADDPRAVTALGALRWLATTPPAGAATRPRKLRSTALVVAALVLLSFVAGALTRWPTEKFDRAEPIGRPLVPARSPAATARSNPPAGAGLAYLIRNASGVDHSTCVNPNGTRLLPGAVGSYEVITCRSSAGLPIAFARFSSPAVMAAGFDREARLNVDQTSPTASCDQGVEDDTFWNDASGRRRGRLICAYTDEGRFSYLWGYADLGVMAFLVGDAPTVEAWWSAHADFVR